jgi:lipid II:glycine glycyltransferase (peptidoglycan interpeptide bridge formation enzyme)
VSIAAALDDPAAWNAFVQRSDPGSYLQLRPWADVKRTNGWTSTRLGVDVGDGATAISIGAQILLRRPGPLPWAFAYAPRGPVTPAWRPELIGPFTEAARAGLAASGGRVSHLRIDPEVELDGPHDTDAALRAALRAGGWRPAPPIQPASTRLIDLRAEEDALWSDLRKKWRQYVNRARTGGVTVEDAGDEALGTFYSIYRETAARAGFLIRTEAAYRDIWEAYRPLGLARLLIARDRGGEPSAALFLVRCGTRVVEPYGGMTQAGAESRANYLLKWEAIRSSREAGAETYDLWGLAHPGIAHFKAGFGGREVRYVGAWDLVLDRLGRTVYGVAQRGRVWLERRRHGLGRGTAVAPGTGGDGGGEGDDGATGPAGTPGTAGGSAGA